MKTIIVTNTLQQDYHYGLTEPAGGNFDPEFTPDLTPKEMLQLGVFGGNYMADSLEEFPRDWFEGVQISVDKHDAELNYFKVNASQPLEVWQKKDWIYHEDPHGWFQWYCRYYLGRRCQDDARQIKRWKAMKRHIAQIQRNCSPGDASCRPKQRQALLHWAYDSRKL